MSQDRGERGNPELAEYRARAWEWLAANMTRGRTRYQRSGHGAQPSEEFVAEQRGLQACLYEGGFAGITWPREYGGAGLSPAHQRVFDEEARGYVLPVLGGVTLGMIAPTLLVYGSEEQKKEWIPRMLSGRDIWVQLLSEPAAGSDLAGVRTRADRDGDEWVINGSKVWSTGAMHADAGMCLARTDWSAPKHRGLTWFRVDLRSPGVTVRPIREINGGAEFCEEFLDGVRVPAGHVIGEVDRGWPVANTLLAFERAIVGPSPGAGADPGSGSMAPDLVALARRTGRDADPYFRQRIAEAHAADYMQHQLTRWVAAAIGRKIQDPTTASLIKLGTGINNPRRARLGMELAGASGIAWEPASAVGPGPGTDYLNGRIMSIAGGSNEIQRNIIGERLLGLPREPSFDNEKPFSDVLRDAATWGSRPPPGTGAS